MHGIYTLHTLHHLPAAHWKSPCRSSPARRSPQQSGPVGALGCHRHWAMRAWRPASELSCSSSSGVCMYM